MRLADEVVLVTGGGSGMAQELAGPGVHVTVVFPGAIGTDIAANSGVALPGAAPSGVQSALVTRPARAARVMLDGIERNAYRILVGHDARLGDALCRLDPRRPATLIGTWMRRVLLSTT